MATEGQRGFKQVPDFEKNEAGDIIRPSDPVAFFEAKEQRVRERFINVAQAKVLREQVRQCYYKSGVNHYQDCKELVAAYMKKINSPNFGMQG